MSDDLRIIRKTKDVITHTHALLKQKVKVNTKAVLWKIERTDKDSGYSLKIGRYSNPWDDLECEKPRSELTLDQEELDNLITFISENYKLMKIGAGTYIKADALNNELAKQLQEIFNSKESAEISDFFIKNNLLSYDTSSMITFLQREKSLIDFRDALDKNMPESFWQKWFEDNNWVLGNEFARIIDDRKIDTKNIADYLMETYDGFVDIVEIKRPNGNLNFWDTQRDHDNLIPSKELIKAITQAQNYVQSLEEEMDSVKTAKRLGGISIVKPRATLIFGRSNDWGKDERKAFRILNFGYKDFTILTYDQVLARAKKTLNLARYRNKN